MRDHKVLSLLAVISSLLLLPVVAHSGLLPGGLSLPIVVGIVALFVVVENGGLVVARFLAHYHHGFLKLARFCSVGLFNTSFDLSIINALIYLSGVYAGPVLVLFNAVSFTTTGVTSYFMNRKFSFESAARPHTLEFSLFMTVAAGSLILNSIFIYFWTTVWGAPLGVNPALWVTSGKVAGAFISLVWNFSGMYLLFHQKHVA